MAFALLVILAVESGEGGAAEVLGETLPEIGVEVDTAGLGAFGRAHAAHGEGTYEGFISRLFLGR